MWCGCGDDADDAKLRQELVVQMARQLAVDAILTEGIGITGKPRGSKLVPQRVHGREACRDRPLASGRGDACYKPLRCTTRRDYLPPLSEWMSPGVGIDKSTPPNHRVLPTALSHAATALSQDAKAFCLCFR